MRDGDDDDNDNRSLPTINKTCGNGYCRHVDPNINKTLDMIHYGYVHESGQRTSFAA